jgi:hypothetical protein
MRQARAATSCTTGLRDRTDGKNFQRYGRRIVGIPQAAWEPVAVIAGCEVDPRLRCIDHLYHF